MAHVPSLWYKSSRKVVGESLMFSNQEKEEVMTTSLVRRNSAVFNSILLATAASVRSVPDDTSLFLHQDQDRQNNPEAVPHQLLHEIILSHKDNIKERQYFILRVIFY